MAAAPGQVLDDRSRHCERRIRNDAESPVGEGHNRGVLFDDLDVAPHAFAQQTRSAGVQLDRDHPDPRRSEGSGETSVAGAEIEHEIG